jgi:hypothetical protein
VSINPRLLSFVLLLSAPLTAQTISPAPAVGDLTVTLVTAPAKAGAMIDIFSGSAAAGCAASTSALKLAPNTGKTVLGGQAQTAVTLATPLTSANVFLCAVLTDPDKKTTLKVPPVAVGPAAPLPDATKPVVAPGKGTALPVVSTVNQSIRIDAVLIPPVIVKRIFGKEVAQNYAAVQIIIANHNQDASFILESTAMDYSHWLFSNNFQLPNAGGKTCPTSDVPSASFNTCNQIASAESRTVRSELEDAQVWSLRNIILRSATLAGSIAAGYIFLAQNPDYTTGVTNYTGQVLPALNAFLPDRSQAQINNISDYGFKTPHVIAKASSDIIVAFFPLADFLTPKLREIYINSPAAFNTPGEMLIDSKLTKKLAAMMEGAGALNMHNIKDLKGKDRTAAELSQISAALGRYEARQAFLAAYPPPAPADPGKAPASPAVPTDPAATEKSAKAPELDPRDLTILGILQKASLNNINVLVDGIMTVDVNAVPAAIKDPVVITDDKKPATWAKGATVKGIINGSFLASGTVALAKAVTGMPSDFTVDTKTSTDSTLNFSFVPTADIPQGTELDFVVTKKASDGSTTSSPPSKYIVPIVTTISNVAIDNEAQATTWKKGATVTGTLTGTDLSAPPGGSVSVAVTPAVTGIPATITVEKTSTDTALNISFTLTDDVAAKTVLNFVVTKVAADKTTVTATAKPYTVPAPAAGAAVVKPAAAPAAAPAGPS